MICTDTARQCDGPLMLLYCVHVERVLEKVADRHVLTLVFKLVEDETDAERLRGHLVEGSGPGRT